MSQILADAKEAHSELTFALEQGDKRAASKYMKRLKLCIDRLAQAPSDNLEDYLP
jgi:hypothetical protein